VPQIISQQNFNPASLQLDDIYLVIQPPPSYIAGVSTDTALVVGTASWGPVNAPQLLGSPADLVRTFGGVTAAALTDLHDLATDVVIAFTQSQGAQGSLQVWGVRVTDGTDTPAQVTLDDTTTPTALAGATLTAKYTGTLGNQIQVTVQAGTAANTFTVVVVGPTGTQPERYPNLAGAASGASPFWAALVNAITNGLSGVRGPSQLLTATIGASGAINPALGTFTLAGGKDGRSVTTAQLLGSDTAIPKTGLYAGRSLSPDAGVVWIAGLTDTSAYPSIQAFADSEGALALLTQPAGTSTTAFLSTVQTVGITDPFVAWVKDWIYWYDQVNNKVRLVPPLAFAGGRIAALNPAESPSNKAVFGVIGTERSNPYTGTVPYSNTEAGQLEAGGVMFITNPSVGGQYWGFRNGVTSSADPATSPVEYARMTYFLSHSIAASLGKVVGDRQSQQPNDPVRKEVRARLNAFLRQLQGQGMIDAYTVICDLTNNSPQSIAQHYLYAFVQVRYLSSVKFFIVQLQGGTTVVLPGNSLQEALATAA
jgi:phage tail sheath protein FI